MAEAEDHRGRSSGGESDFETEVVLQPTAPERKSHKKRQGRKEEDLNQNEVKQSPSNPVEESDDNGNPKETVEVRKSRSKTKHVVPIQAIKLKHWDKVEPPGSNLAVDCSSKYSRATETEYRKAFGIKVPDSPYVPKQYMLRPPRLIEWNKSCLDLAPDAEPRMTWTTTYLQDFKARDGDDEVVCGAAGLPTPKYSYCTTPRRTRSKEKKCFDDDEDVNPTLKYFINSISRK